MHNYFSSGKVETHSCVLSWGFPPKCHIQAEFVYVLDYPPKLDLKKNVREAGRLEQHFEGESPCSWRIQGQSEFHQSWKNINLIDLVD